MVVLHALSEYMINKPPPDDLSLNVDIRMAGRKENRYYFNPDTAYVARSSRVRQCCIWTHNVKALQSVVITVSMDI